jgi:hypothetical protein
MFYFDTINGIMKIKFYKFRLASSKFYSAEQIDNTNFKIKHNTFGYYGINERDDLGKMRNPEVGDYAYTIDSAGNFTAASKIIKLKDSVMQVETDLIIGTNEKLCYADGKVLSPGVSMFNPISSGSILESLTNDSQILYKKPKTTYTADDYIFVDNINGFSLIRY